MSTDALTVDAILERVRRDGVRKAALALRKPPVPSRLLQELSERRDVPEASQFVAAYPLAPSHLLEALAQAAPDTVVLSLLATNPRTPPHLLTTFTTHPDASVRASVAQHTQIPPRELFTLAEDAAPEVRRALASNPSLRLPHQSMLVADADPAVRVKLAGQGALPKQVVLALGADASPVVRGHLVATAKVEEDVLLSWAASDEEDLQLAVAAREDLPASAQRLLAVSPHAAVRRQLRERGSIDDVELLFLATQGEVDERVWVAKRDLLARPLQSVLAQDATSEVRAALAGNVSLDEEIARYFVGQAEEEVCAILAINPAVPLDLVQELAATRYPRVLAALAYREVLEGELVQFLLVHSPEFRGHWALQQRGISGLDFETAKTLFADPLPSVRALAIRGCALWRLADLYEIARDPAPAVRLAALQHARASDELIAERLSDPVASIAAAAQELRETRQRTAAVALKSQATAGAARGGSASAAGGTASVALPHSGASGHSPVASATTATAGTAQASAPLRAADPLPARPASRLVERTNSGLFNKLKRIFWQ